MMFVWKLWPVWVRVLITVFYVLVVLGTILATVGLGILVSNWRSVASLKMTKAGTFSAVAIELLKLRSASKSPLFVTSGFSVDFDFLESINF